jgi:phage shock protein PspC (stress-responsive transcriptional regulator)
MTETSYRKLYRSRTHRMLTGVCGGLAEYANVDPTIVRLLFVVAAFVTGGAALLAYPILWVIMPEAPQQPAAWTPTEPAAQPAAWASAEAATPPAA